MHPLAAKRQQWRGPAGCLKWLKVRSPSSALIPEPKREAKVCIGNSKSPHAGAGRQPPDREVLRAACHRAAPEEAPQKVSWAVMPPPVAEYGTRVPSLYFC